MHRNVVLRTAAISSGFAIKSQLDNTDLNKYVWLA